VVVSVTNISLVRPGLGEQPENGGSCTGCAHRSDCYVQVVSAQSHHPPCPELISAFKLSTDLAQPDFSRTVNGHDTVVAMGGPHIFGFPLALRKTKAPSARSAPSTPIETSGRSLVKEQPTQSRNGTYTSTGIQEQHRYTSVSKDPGLGGISASDMATESGTLVATADEEAGRFLFTIHQKPSSQLLGNQNYECSQNSESGVDQTTQSLRGYKSSSTLRSFYDPQQAPLSISQQTSDSSARDLALRKGCPPVVSMEKSISQSPQASGVSTPKSTKTGLIRLDLSMLFPKPSSRHGHLTQSPIGGGPSDAISEQLVMPPAVPFGPSTSQKRRLNTADAKKALPLFRKPNESTLSFDSQESSRMGARTPKSGIKHWVDNFEDEDIEDVDQYESVEPRPPTRRDTQPPSKITPETYYHNAYDTSFQNKRLDPNTGRSHPRLKMLSATERRTASPAREELRLALHNSEFRSKHQGTIPAKRRTMHFRKRRNNPFDKIDVHKDSVLCLSSSDDESEADESPQSDIGSTIPGIRDSLIIEASDNSDVEIGTAHAIKTNRPKLEQDPPREESRSQASRVSKYSLKTVNIPERHSSRIFSFLSDQSRSLSNTQEGSVAVPPLPATPSELIGNYHHTSQQRNSVNRLMTVTPQEQWLLEAIRTKQASRHQSIIPESFPRTPELEQGESNVSTRRPHTSGIGGHSASFFHLGQESVPTVPSFHKHRRSISAGELLEYNGTESRKSCSIDLVTSRRGSLAYSSLPSSSSQEYPPTPTFELAPDTSTRRANSSTKRFSNLPTNYQRHSRIRTGSSGVIVLDNPDDDSSRHFKSDDLPVWVFNGWFDKPGLAAVH
jgi:hypothetical protein